MRKLTQRLMGWAAGLLPLCLPALALAEGAGGSYRGIAQMYYTLIAVVLIFGVHDIFHSRNITIASAVIIPLGIYFLLLPNG